MRRNTLFAAGLVLVLFIIGCEYNSTRFEALGEAVTIAEEEVFDLKATEATDRDIKSASFGGHMLKGGMRIGGPHLFFGRHFPACATVTVSSDEFPKEIVIEYGDECSGDLGMQRSGTITLEMTDTILNAGAVYTITYEDVTFGRKQVDRTATITNEGINEDGNWVISYQSVTTTTFEHEGEIISITREVSGQKEWLAGFDTPGVADDQLLRTGGGTMMVNDEIKFERTVTELFVNRACKYPQSGTIEITRDGETMIIDFGDGECDNKAVVTKDGESEEIDLNRGRFRHGFQRHNRHMKMQKKWW